MTNLLILLNVAVFAIELAWKLAHTDNISGVTIAHLLGSSLDRDLTYSFIPAGALISPLVLKGAWWRVVTANFLHAGVLHLLMNVLALSFLGKFVERELGHFKLAIGYALTGVGSMMAVTYWDFLYPTKPPTWTVGASGAIMGLLGIMGAICLVSWWRTRAKSASQQLKSILTIVILQLIFDFAYGHTSVVGHYSGLAIGLAIGAIL
jgi:rhomboid protease GluP